MTRREALLKIIAQLKRINGRTSPWNSDYQFNVDVHETVLPYEEFIDNINSFPCVMLTFIDTQVRHIGGGERYLVTSFRIRGITWDDQVEDAGELLADDLEHALSYVRREHTEFEECRIDTVQTDEGLNAPLGAVIVEGTLVYKHE